MTYPGGKGASGVAQTIINQQPPHTTYVELFLGGGAVMQAKRPASFNIGFDLAAGPIANFQAVQIPHSHFYRQCGIAFMETDAWDLERTSLIYCDPPYVLSARCRPNRKRYQYEMTDVDHRRFLRAALALRCMIQISGYWSPLYAEMLEGWRLVKFMAMTRGGLKEECLWMNYPEPAALHDYRFLGADFRERERIKRKTSRWTARIAALPQLERLALLSAMTAESVNCGGPGSHAESRERTRRSTADSTIPAIGDRYSPALEVLQ